MVAPLRNYAATSTAAESGSIMLRRAPIPASHLYLAAQTLAESTLQLGQIVDLTTKLAGPPAYSVGAAPAAPDRVVTVTYTDNQAHAQVPVHLAPYSVHARSNLLIDGDIPAIAVERQFATATILASGSLPAASLNGGTFTSVAYASQAARDAFENVLNMHMSVRIGPVQAKPTVSVNLFELTVREYLTSVAQPLMFGLLNMVENLAARLSASNLSSLTEVEQENVWVGVQALDIDGLRRAVEQLRVLRMPDGSVLYTPATPIGVNFEIIRRATVFGMQIPGYAGFEA